MPDIAQLCFINSSWCTVEDKVGQIIQEEPLNGWQAFTRKAPPFTTYAIIYIYCELNLTSLSQSCLPLLNAEISNIDATFFVGVLQLLILAFISDVGNDNVYALPLTVMLADNCTG